LPTFYHLPIFLFHFEFHFSIIVFPFKRFLAISEFSFQLIIFIVLTISSLLPISFKITCYQLLTNLLLISTTINAIILFDFVHEIILHKYFGLLIFFETLEKPLPNLFYVQLLGLIISNCSNSYNISIFTYSYIHRIF